MKNLVWASAILATPLIAPTAYAQAQPVDKAGQLPSYRDNGGK